MGEISTLRRRMIEDMTVRESCPRRRNNPTLTPYRSSAGILVALLIAQTAPRRQNQRTFSL